MDFFGKRSPAEDDDADESLPPAPPPREDEPDAPSSPTRHASSRIFDTALGAGCVVEGTLSSDGNVRLDGKFTGTLDIGENVLVGITAEIEADVVAQNISVAGMVHGNVKGKKVHLLSTAQVWGDIIAESLITEDGAFIEGRIRMNEARNSDAPPSLTAGEEDKDAETSNGGN